MPRRLSSWLSLVLRGAGGLALACSVAQDAVAQARVDVRPSVGVSETWSDNVTLLGGEGESGFTTNVTGRIGVMATGGKLTGRAGYGLNVAIEHFEGGETRLEHDATAALEYRLSPRWRFALQEDFRFSPDPTRSLVFVTPEGAVFRRFEEVVVQPGVDVLDVRILRLQEDQLRNRLALEASYALTPRWSTGLEGIWLVQSSEDDIFGEDSQTIGGRLETDYRLTPIDDVSLTVGADSTDFEVAPDALLLRAELGWTRELRQTLDLVLTAGYVRVDSDEAPGGNGAGDENEFTGSAALIGELLGGRWRLSVARDVSTGDASGDISERLVAEAGATREIGAALIGDVTLRYLRSRSVRGFGAEADVFEGIAGVSYRFTRWISARATYRYRRDDPTGPGSVITENSVLIGVELQWPIRDLAGLRSAS